MHHPTIGTVVALRRAVSRCYERVHVIKQRRVALGEVADFRHPIVHLEVDVGVEIAVPRRVHVLIPDALQIRRQAPWPRTPHQQIPSELEIERDEVRIEPASLHGFQAFIGREMDCVGCP